MKFALCNELFQDWSMEKSLELTCDCGYSGWEIAPFTLAKSADEVTSSQRKGIRNLIESFNIDVVGLHWLLAKTEGYHLTTPDEQIRRRTAQYLNQLSALCRDLGGHIMVLGSPQQRNFPVDMTHQQAADNALSLLEIVVKQLETDNVILALEPLGPGEGNFWNFASQAVEVIEKLNSPFVQLHLDVKAMSTEGKPIDDIIRENEEHMVHFHANDPNLLGPGMGDVDFRPIFQALKDVAYNGWVSVEVFDYSPGIENIARNSMRNMQAALDAIS
ncbi:MAG: sugar phosphate isomerase/epimerase [Planctomycetales bacterium]|nr:sugar phosphate isomerase/epimerase [Planctomycetales bacterium]